MVAKPSTDATTRGMAYALMDASHRTNSTPRHSSTQPQPMNTADEYRLVTGGLPVRYIRNARAKVWTTTITTVSQRADRRNGSCQTTHDTMDSNRTRTYRLAHW